MNIRHYQPADRAAVIALWQAVLPDAAPYNEPGASLDAKLAVDDMVFVAHCGGRLCGTTMAGYDGHRGWLYSVAVLPQFRGRGVGAALIRHALSQLAERGCPKVNLQVKVDNEGVVAFYRSLGFAVEPRISMGVRVATS